MAAEPSSPPAPAWQPLAWTAVGRERNPRGFALGEADGPRKALYGVENHHLTQRDSSQQSGVARQIDWADGRQEALVALDTANGAARSGTRVECAASLLAAQSELELRSVACAAGPRAASAWRTSAAGCWCAGRTASSRSRSPARRSAARGPCTSPTRSAARLCGGPRRLRAGGRRLVNSGVASVGLAGLPVSMHLLEAVVPGFST